MVSGERGRGRKGVSVRLPNKVRSREQVPSRRFARSGDVLDESGGLCEQRRVREGGSGQRTGVGQSGGEGEGRAAASEVVKKAPRCACGEDLARAPPQNH